MPLCRPRSPRPLVLLPGSKYQPHKHVPSQSSYLTFPPSPTSLLAIPRTPLTPPLRLHLRTLHSDLPSPPISPQYLTSAPQIPSPWIWRCHMCGSIYKLGVTRRCLHDGHFFCSVPLPAPDTPLSEDEGNDSSASSKRSISPSDILLAKERQTRNAKRRRERSRREKRRAVGCTAEFDYAGWAQYNVWRRSIEIYKFEKAHALKKQQRAGRCGVANAKDDDYWEEHEWKGQKDCWSDCEFPSECHNSRLQEKLERRRIKGLFVDEESRSDTGIQDDGPSDDRKGEGEERSNSQGKVMGIEEWEARLQHQKLAEFEREEENLEQLEKVVVAIHGIDPLSPPSSRFSSTTTMTTNSASAEETDIIDMERRGLEGEAQMVDVTLGPISPNASSFEDLEEEIDCFNGSGFASRKRKKSIQKIAQLTGLMLGVEPVERDYEEEKPRSPLREGFTFSEASWAMDRAYGSGVDREIEELERSGNMLRRRVGRGEMGEFGGEDEDEDYDTTSYLI